MDAVCVRSDTLGNPRCRVCARYGDARRLLICSTLDLATGVARRVWANDSRWPQRSGTVDVDRSGDAPAVNATTYQAVSHWSRSIPSAPRARTVMSSMRSRSLSETSLLSTMRCEISGP